MFIARKPMSLLRRSEEQKVSRRVPVQLSSAPPNGAWFWFTFWSINISLLRSEEFS